MGLPLLSTPAVDSPLSLKVTRNCVRPVVPATLFELSELKPLPVLLQPKHVTTGPKAVKCSPKELFNALGTTPAKFAETGDTAVTDAPII